MRIAGGEASGEVRITRETLHGALSTRREGDGMGMFLLTAFVYLAGWGVICLLDAIHDELIAIREALTVPVESLGREA